MVRACAYSDNLLCKDIQRRFGNHHAVKFATPDGNSGIQFRSKLIDPKMFVVGGYQGDFDGKGGFEVTEVALVSPAQATVD